MNADPFPTNRRRDLRYDPDFDKGLISEEFVELLQKILLDPRLVNILLIKMEFPDFSFREIALQMKQRGFRVSHEWVRNNLKTAYTLITQNDKAKRFYRELIG